MLNRLFGKKQKNETKAPSIVCGFCHNKIVNNDYAVVVDPDLPDYKEPMCQECQKLEDDWAAILPC